MGLFQYFKNLKEKHKQRSIAKHSKTIKNPKAIKEERAGAIEFFKNLKDMNAAVPALLKRFDYSLDHGIYDTREKEAAMEGILVHGKEAIPLIRKHLSDSTRIAWPIKLIQKLGEESMVIEALESCLFLSDFEFDRDKIDKNYDVLCYLRDYQLPDQGKKLVPLLDALDERIRFAVAEVLINQEPPQYLESMEKFLSDTSAENTRIHQIVLSSFLDKKWATHLDMPAGSEIVPGVVLQQDKTLRKV